VTKAIFSNRHAVCVPDELAEKLEGLRDALDLEIEEDREEYDYVFERNIDAAISALFTTSEIYVMSDRLLAETEIGGYVDENKWIYRCPICRKVMDWELTCASTLVALAAKWCFPETVLACNDHCHKYRRKTKEDACFCPSATSCVSEFMIRVF